MDCAINLGTSVLLTGGFSSVSRVTEYNEAGYVRDLPPLQQGRRTHGCTYYDNEEGTKVDIESHYWGLIVFQTFLVSGGFNGDAFLSSTELLVETELAWILVGELPSPRNGPCVANIDNKILMTGN